MARFQYDKTLGRMAMEDERQRFGDLRNERRTTIGTPYERTRAAVYARGNKWQIENFEATH